MAMTDQALLPGLASSASAPASPAPIDPVAVPSPSSALLAEAAGVPRMQEVNRDQLILIPFNIEQLLPEHHPARTIWAFVRKLDLSAYTAAIRSVQGAAGRPPIDPAILLSLWLFALSDGVGSAREIARLAEVHDAYRWLCGGVSVNYHTLSDFRLGEEKLEALLSGWLGSLTYATGLKLHRVSQDGLRIRASAGAASFRRKPTLEDHVREAEAQVQRLKEERESESAGARSAREIAAQERAARQREARIKEALRLLPEAQRVVQRRTDKARPKEPRISTTDPEAHVMKMPDGGFRPAYNTQVVSDNETGYVVGTAVSTVGSDMGQLPAMLDKLEACFGELPDELLCDGGYPSQESLKYAHERGITIYAPVPKNRSGADQFAPRTTDDPARAAWRKRMATDEAKAIYKERGATIELTNARFRRMSLSAFLVRGKKKVHAMVVLVALAHNALQEEALRRKRLLSAAV